MTRSADLVSKQAGCLVNPAVRSSLVQEHDLLQHNLVVFRNGENAIQARYASAAG